MSPRKKAWLQLTDKVLDSITRVHLKAKYPRDYRQIYIWPVCESEREVNWFSLLYCSFKMHYLDWFNLHATIFLFCSDGAIILAKSDRSCSATKSSSTETSHVLQKRSKYKINDNNWLVSGRRRCLRQIAGRLIIDLSSFIGLSLGSHDMTWHDRWLVLKQYEKLRRSSIDLENY